MAWGHGLQRPGVFGAISGVRDKGQAQWALRKSCGMIIAVSDVVGTIVSLGSLSATPLCLCFPPRQPPHPPTRSHPAVPTGSSGQVARRVAGGCD